jgi:hypothetical protein
MDTVRSYHQLAFHCMKLAHAVDDPGTQDQLVQLAEAYTSLAEHAQKKLKSPQADYARAK